MVSEVASVDDSWMEPQPLETGEDSPDDGFFVVFRGTFTFWNSKLLQLNYFLDILLIQVFNLLGLFQHTKKTVCAASSKL